MEIIQMSGSVNLVLICLLWIVLQSVTAQTSISPARERHQLKELNGRQVKAIAKLSNNSLFRREILQPLLIERVVDTAGSRRAQEHIKQWMATKLLWHVEEDSFHSNTPLGTKKFTNIIATHDPAAKRQLVLACHFDSKLFNTFTFIGATDAAVPCAMIIDLARTLNNKLGSRDRLGNDISLQLIFFDGEEAFQRWTSTDSLYGSRHLAAAWADTPHSHYSNGSKLDGIDMLVLLDLIGARNPEFANLFPEMTGRFFEGLNAIEGQLHQARLLRGHTTNQYFDLTRRRGAVQDDHIPFLEQDVPILHLISVPFPRVWHTRRDDGSAVDYRTVNNLNRIIRVFIARYLHLTT
ncbi:glutaminyl-peptide cyclotransferase-like [Watersipora subatra]|uniref:glutaminyl-peptide cyclotransferase-like n=1 Tax=Watersipora subatra TaxID=2589382 RepID=UPI00355C5571